MELFAGVWARRGSLAPVPACRDMLHAMGVEIADLATPVADLAFGSSRKAKVGPLGTKAAVVVGKIANRAEICRRFGIGEPDGFTDAALSLSLWRSHGHDGLGAIVGSIAGLVFDTFASELIAWRAAGSERQLFFAARPGLIAAASRPEALFAHPDIPKALNFLAAAAWAAQIYSPGPDSMFQGVQRVLPGQILSLHPDRESKEVWRWRPHRTRRVFSDFKEACAELRSVFDNAVGDALPPRGTNCAAMLSSGRDSSAVVASASAALRERGETLLALTGAPAEGVAALPVAGRIADESAAAAAVASRLGNVDHRVCRSAPGTILTRLSELHRNSVQPVGNLCNLPWYLAALDTAQAHGCKVLLQGTAGNLTISAGTREFLWDVMREDGWGALGSALRTANGSLGDWLRTGHALLGPALPQPLYLRLAAMAGRYDRDEGMFPSLRPPFRAAAETELGEVTPSYQPRRSGFAWRAAMLRAHDHAEIFHPRLYDVESRDPTNDPRVVELMLAMPAAFLVPTRSEPRPLYAGAFGKRLPREVVVGAQRGYQGADWHVQFPVAEVHSHLQRILSHPLNAELFDREFLLTTVLQRSNNPAHLTDDSTLRMHRSIVLGALAVAGWVNVHFPA